MPTSDFNKQDQHVPVRAAELDTVYDEGPQENLKEQLRQTLLACSQCTGEAAHDLNNILTIISGHADVLAIATKPNDPNQQSIKAIIDAVSRATGVTQRLASFSQTLIVQSSPSCQVLVVDNNVNICQMFKLALKSVGIEACIAESGEKAVEIFRSSPSSIKAVLMDIVMPGLNGLDTMAVLRTINPALPAVFMTASAETYRAAVFAKFGADVRIKPFEDIHEIVTLLRQMIESTDSSADDKQKG